MEGLIHINVTIEERDDFDALRSELADWLFEYGLRLHKVAAEISYAEVVS